MKPHQRLLTRTLGLSLTLVGVTMLPSVMAAAVSPAKTVTIAGAAMNPSKNIIQNIANSKDHTTLMSAVKAAGLVDTLSGTGPFTVFAPTDKAFAALPAGTIDNLMKPENKAALAKLLTYHVVAGRLTMHDLSKAAEASGGIVDLKTLEGDSITISKDANRWAISDDKGNVAHITIADMTQSNGVIFVIDQALVP